MHGTRKPVFIVRKGLSDVYIDMDWKLKRLGQFFYALMLCLQKNHPKLLAYVIGIHAVQFGNNWMKKILRIGKLDEAYRLIQQASSNLSVRGIFWIQLFPNWTSM